MSDPPITHSQRVYLDCFLRWLRDSTRDNLFARKEALRRMLGEAGVPFVRTQAVMA